MFQKVAFVGKSYGALLFLSIAFGTKERQTSANILKLCFLPFFLRFLSEDLSQDLSLAGLERRRATQSHGLDNETV